MHAHLLEGTQCCEAILTLQKAVDFAGTLRKRCQHDRAMRD
jgi:hypothetical protein